mgnify:CR=1 FL=1
MVGYFSYDIIRYIEKIPNNCVDDLNLPDVRILRPTSLIIHDNIKKKIFYIVNCYNDEKISDYRSKLEMIKQELVNLEKCAKYNIGNSIPTVVTYRRAVCVVLLVRYNHLAHNINIIYGCIKIFPFDL